MFIYTEKVSYNSPEEFFTEATLANLYNFKNEIYPEVEKVLSTEQGKRNFSKLVGDYINRNSSKLTTIGPVYQIPFTFEDKKSVYDLFNLTEKQVLDIVKKSRKELNTSIPPWQSISQNPVFVVLYQIIRFFTLEKNSKQLNNALIIMALAVYPSIFYKYFRNWTINTGVMQYTIDNLSQRFVIKKSNHLFGALSYFIQNSWKSHERNIIDGSDDNCVQFAWRVHNDQNSFMKKIAQNYNNNKNQGLMVTTDTDSYDDNAVVDVENDTNKVSAMVDKIVLQIVVNGLDLRLCDFAANAANISKIELRNYLMKIISDKNSNDMKSFIESILFIYLYYEKKTYENINSKEFLSFALALFKKTNSKDSNISNIKKILDKWGTDSGVYGKFSRVATRIDYTKGIYLFFVLCIQKYS